MIATATELRSLDLETLFPIGSCCFVMVQDSPDFGVLAGDYIVVCRERPIKHGCLVVVIVAEQGARLRRYEESLGTKTVRLISGGGEPDLIAEQGCRVFGRCIGVVRTESR
jgi:SOS-response transcriptional repressor LexA